jgi:two-component system, LytTR family, sensor histidine kinase LytS
MTTSLLIILAERMSMVATTAFILSQTTVFQRLVNRRSDFLDHLKLVFLFGLLGIVGTYTGIPIQDALANSRVIGVMVAGLLGGPMVGATVGLIAGLHRYFLGGFTAFACAIASIAEGILGGMVSRLYRDRSIPWHVALLAGLAGEILQMGIILATAKPFTAALQLVETIGVPMIVVNSIGIAVFMLIVKSADEQNKRIGAVQAQKALDIATQTLPYLRKGLTLHSATEAARIMYHMNDYAAVSLTDTHTILAHVGDGSDHHIPGASHLTAATQHALETGSIQIAENKEAIGCGHYSCQLGSAVIVPLHRGSRIIGTLKLYHSVENQISPLDLQLAAGLAHLFSTQLELAEIDHQAKLATHAEMRALQAQINPHFLFNTLNTISSLIRTQPETAREIIVKLSAFFRHSLQKTERHISLAEELAQVDAYLAIEKVRFGDKLTITRHIDPDALTALIPSFTLQPLVENAVKHGLHPKETGGTITILVQQADTDVEIVIADDGIGIPEHEQTKLCKVGYGKGNGIGLANVYERLKGIYGESYGLKIESRLGEGTIVRIRIPLDSREEGDRYAC